jgi:hypothetical protein
MTADSLFWKVVAIGIIVLYIRSNASEIILQGSQGVVVLWAVVLVAIAVYSVFMKKPKEVTKQ